MNNLGLQDWTGLPEGSVVAGGYDKGEVEMLFKAMQAGELTGQEVNNMLDQSGAPLKVESLENTLKIMTSQPKHTPFFAKIGKKPATNTVEAYRQLVSYGDFDGGFTVEGGLPEELDSIYRRKAQLVKFLGLVGGVTHPMQLVNIGSGISNMIAQETHNKVRKMMELMEYYLPFADSRVVPEHFNGLLTQHETESEYPSYDAYMNSNLVVDCNGFVLTDTDVENASLTLVNNYAIGDIIIGSPAVFSSFVTRYHNKKMIYPIPQMVRDGVFGQRVNEIITQNGAIQVLQSNFFRNNQSKRTSSPATSQKAPEVPSAVAVAAVTDTLSKIRPVGKYGVDSSVAEAGDYIYAVAAMNKYGTSAVKQSSTISVAAGQAVDITITETAGAFTPTAYRVYRSQRDPASADVEMFHLFDVPVANAPGLDLASGYDGAAANKIRDRFRYIPGTEQAWLPEWDEEQIFAWKQLAPLMKMNLAITAPISRFMVLLYGTPILYQPRKSIRFINIGKGLPLNG